MPVQAQGSLLAGRYRVLGRLGSGGMATVLLCRDERLGREVAVKRLHADGPAEVEARFVREAKLGASLNHPNLVSVFDTAVDDEGVLIVMEHVAGEPLARALRRAPLEPRAAARVARDLGDALDHAHAHGVVHRDVKPSNVLLREDGVTKLADLGIAVASDQTRITRSGTVLGSAAYMAPEQLEGGEVGPAVDVYALAAVCFEALAGERARQGRTPMEIAHRIATEGPPDVREQVPWVPAEAAEALARGMAREPSHRPRSAGELAETVASALERSDPSEARTATTAARPATKARPAAPPATGGPPTAATTASRPLAGTPSRRSLGRTLAPLLLLLALVAVAAAVLLSDGGDGGGGTADSGRDQEQAQRDRPAQEEQRGGGATGEQPDQGATDDQADAGTTTEQESPSAENPPSGIDPARGAQLNEEGFALMGRGDYAGAVPILQQAVASWPEDSRDLNYAYALYNLGASLHRSGRSAEAIPYLEKRLTWPNQRGVVKRELDAARANAQG